MKKLLLVIAVLLLIGCKKDYSNNDIIGYWVDIDGKKYPTLELKSSNKYSLKLNDDKNSQISGDFKQSESTIYLKTEFGELKYNFSFSGPDVIHLDTGHGDIMPGSVMTLKRR